MRGGTATRSADTSGAACGTGFGAASGHRELRIGVSGHIGLAAGSDRLVRLALRAALREVHRQAGCRPIHGLTCLAEGSDQLFAEEIVAVGATFDVVLPAPDYRSRCIRPVRRPAFDDLLALARSVSYAGTVSGSRTYAEAGRLVLDRCDLLFAVWDGTEGGVGGTAEMVAEANRRGITVRVIWPPGAARR